MVREYFYAKKENINSTLFNEQSKSYMKPKDLGVIK